MNTKAESLALVIEFLYKFLDSKLATRLPFSGGEGVT
jgi:hypothetical protein